MGISPGKNLIGPCDLLLGKRELIAQDPTEQPLAAHAQLPVDGGHTSRRPVRGEHQGESNPTQW